MSAPVALLALVVANNGLSLDQAKAAAENTPVLRDVRSTAKEVGIDGIAGIRSSFVVAAQPEAVFAALEKVENFKTFFKTVDTVKVLKREGDSVHVDLVESGWLMDFSYTLDMKFNKDAGRIDFTEIGGDLKYFRGSWVLEKLSDEGPGFTRVTYTNDADGGALMPDSAMMSTMKDLMLEFANRVRKHVTK